MSEALSHVPVMLDDVLDYISPQDGEVYVDGTFGAGGYTKAILDAADCTVIALDRDVSAQKFAERLQDEYKGRFIFRKAQFGDMRNVLSEIDISSVDGIVLDIGVSSMQLGEAERGFSFRYDGPLDMRMDQESGSTAADLIESLEEKELAKIIWEYGEERHSRKIARKICQVRENSQIRTTYMLADIVRSCVPGRAKPGLDKATKTFQALRIAVNDELGQLHSVLDASLDVLKEGGRLVVVSFHSLEDRIVKQFIRSQTQKPSSPSRYMPETQDSDQPDFVSLTKKAAMPRESEVGNNPRARSARLRAMRKKRSHELMEGS